VIIACRNKSDFSFLIPTSAVNVTLLAFALTLQSCRRLQYGIVIPAAIRDPGVLYTSSCQCTLRDVTTLPSPASTSHIVTPPLSPFECDVIYGRPLTDCGMRHRANCRRRTMLLLLLRRLLVQYIWPLGFFCGHPLGFGIHCLTT